MIVKIITNDYTAQRVSIDCTPTEYLTIKIALQHLANISDNDIKYAKQIIDEEQVDSEDKKDCTTCIGLEDADYERWFCHDCIKGIQNHYKAESEETETWNGIHAQITAPKGTFERIWNDAESEET